MNKKLSVSNKVTSSRNSAIKNADDRLGKYIFKFANGDVYAGGYKATKKREIYREGSGKYFCTDGSVYEGIWHEDHLEEASSLTFANNDVFVGFLTNHQYNSIGQYNMSRVGSIKMMSEYNHPVGDIILTDPIGFDWKGTATKTTSKTTLYPINHFKMVEQEIDYMEGEDSEFQ